MNNKYLLVVVGPTAIGKTDVAIQVARHFNTVIINADSRQIYHEMNIGTAVPSSEQQAMVQHYFINHKSIHDYYNASHFETEVIDTLDQLFERQSIVVMAGGSGMYIDAVCKGIDDLPDVDQEIRKKIHAWYSENGIEGLRSKLQQLDPGYYEKADLNNPARIMKALEISEMTGRPYSSFLTGKSKQRNFSAIKVGLDMPRAELHERINRRVDAMIALGLVQEAAGLYPYKNLNALNTVGYKEIFEYLDGKCSLEESIGKIKDHTRQYARRQLTWFRKDKAMPWFHPEDRDALISYFGSHSK
jgi:tRNA dimethylallyltransferase